MNFTIIHKYSSEEKILSFLNLIIKNQNQMSEKLGGIKFILQEASAKVTKIAADVSSLHAQIAALSDAPTPDEIAELKQLSVNLNTQLQAVDDATHDAVVAPAPAPDPVIAPVADPVINQVIDPVTVVDPVIDQPPVVDHSADPAPIADPASTTDPAPVTDPIVDPVPTIDPVAPPVIDPAAQA